MDFTRKDSDETRYDTLVKMYFERLFEYDKEIFGGSVFLVANYEDEDGTANWSFYNDDDIRNVPDYGERFVYFIANIPDDKKISAAYKREVEGQINAAVHCLRSWQSAQDVRNVASMLSGEFARTRERRLRVLRVES